MVGRSRLDISGAVNVHSCLASASYVMNSELLGGDLALDLAEFLFKPCQTGLNRLLLEHRRGEKPIQ